MFLFFSLRAKWDGLAVDCPGREASFPDEAGKLLFQIKLRLQMTFLEKKRNFFSR